MNTQPASPAAVLSQWSRKVISIQRLTLGTRPGGRDTTRPVGPLVPSGNSPTIIHRRDPELVTRREAHAWFDLRQAAARIVPVRHIIAEKFLLFVRCSPKLGDMQEPLALLLYEKVIPGGQLVGRLEDLGYRVKTIADAEVLLSTAEQEKPMLLIADFEPRTEAVARAVTSLKRNTATAHIPVIALVSSRNAAAQTAARTAQANLIVQDSVILQHLPQFLEQALTIE